MPEKVPDSFYVADGEDYVATQLTQGPWESGVQHGGPPSALVCTVAQRRYADALGHRLARVTVEFDKPVPVAKMVVQTQLERGGKRVQGVRATIECNGVTVLRARLLYMARSEMPVQTVVHVAPVLPLPESVPPFVFPFFRDTIGYHRGIELKYVRGKFGEGDAGAWMRTVRPLILGEQTLSIADLMVVVDAANGVSAALDTNRYSFVNPDLTVHISREPRGAWHAIDSQTSVTEDGFGLVDARLSDVDGPIGRALQSLFVRPKPT